MSTDRDLEKHNIKGGHNSPSCDFVVVVLRSVENFLLCLLVDHYAFYARFGCLLDVVLSSIFIQCCLPALTRVISSAVCRYIWAFIIWREWNCAFTHKQLLWFHCGHASFFDSSWTNFINNGNAEMNTWSTALTYWEVLTLMQRFPFLSKEFNNPSVSVVRPVLGRWGVAIMSRYDTKDFGEAAPFLRKTDMELLAAQTVAFDGRPNKETPNEMAPCRAFCGVSVI